MPKWATRCPVTNERDFVVELERILAELAHDRPRLEQLRRQGMTYARERLTWDAKAQDTTKVLEWVVRQGPRPDLPPPKPLAGDVVAATMNVISETGSPAPGGSA